jgi:hypothetical protein
MIFYSTKKIDHANYIEHVKGFRDWKHRHDENGTLWIDFESLKPEQGELFEDEYARSDFYGWDANKRKYFRFMKRR